MTFLEAFFSFSFFPFLIVRVIIHDLSANVATFFSNKDTGLPFVSEIGASEESLTFGIESKQVRMFRCTSREYLTSLLQARLGTYTFILTSLDISVPRL